MQEPEHVTVGIFGSRSLLRAPASRRLHDPRDFGRDAHGTIRAASVSHDQFPWV
jgi:hypothetical protein